MQFDLFEQIEKEAGTEQIAPGAFILHGFAREASLLILSDLKKTLQQSPFRFMQTAGGFVMSVAISNCGSCGWITDLNGYRYSSVDPLNGQPWPAMPNSFAELSHLAAREVGYENFNPDTCSINRYAAGAKLTLHQDKNELDFNAPIVSFSFGIPAIFLFGGLERQDKTASFQLEHGDVVVWGGPSRLAYHGIKPIKAAWHSQTGKVRINITFRKTK